MEEQGEAFLGHLKDEHGFSAAGPIMSRLFSRVDEKIMKETNLLRYNFALQFGQPIVFDFGLPFNMSERQVSLPGAIFI